MTSNASTHPTSSDYPSNFASDSLYSANDFASFTDNKYDKDDDDGSFEIKPNLTVEEIFARGIEEWKRAREEVKSRRKAAGKLPPSGLRLPRSMRGPLYDPNYDAGFDKEVEEILAPNRRKLFDVVKKSSAERVSGEDGEVKQAESSSLPCFQKVIDQQKKRRRGTGDPTDSASETLEETANDPDALHKRKMKRMCGVAADTIRVIVVLAVSFVITGLPWFLEEEEAKPPQFKFDIAESNICYWIGSTSILDPLNPCPYRGYVSMNRRADNCLTWRRVVENTTWVTALEAETKKQAGVLPKDFLKNVRLMAKLYDGEDYNAPFCRRLGGVPPRGGFENDNVNAPKCFVLKDANGNDLKVPRISNCWVFPCTFPISNQCYQDWFMAKSRPSKKK